MDSLQDVDKEVQQEDSIDTVTKAFGTMTAGSTAPATNMVSPWISHFHTLCMTMRQRTVRWLQLILLLLG